MKKILTLILFATMMMAGKMYAQSNLVVPLEHEGTMTVLCGADAFLEVP